MYYVSKGYVHQKKVLASMIEHSHNMFEAVDNNNKFGYAWPKDDSMDTFIFMPYNDEVHENWQSNEFVFIEQKLESELRRLDAEIWEESRQVLA